MALMIETAERYNEINDNACDFKAEFMELALEQAEIGKKCNEIPVGCVIVENNKKVIASSHNQTNITKNGTKHCEIVCINELAKREIYGLSDYYLYVTVEPCIMCASALKIANIKKVFYGAANTKFGGNGSVYPLNEANHLGFPAKCFSFSYPSIKIGDKYEKAAIHLLKTFYECGNETLPLEQRARKRRKLNNDSSND